MGPKAISINISQVYFPTTNAEADKIESFYALHMEETDSTSKQDMLIIIGNWNAEVGHKEEPNVVGEFGHELEMKLEKDS